MSSPHQLSSSAVKLETLSHSNAAKALGSSEEIDSGSDEEDSHSSGAVHPLERSTTESHVRYIYRCELHLSAGATCIIRVTHCWKRSSKLQESLLHGKGHHK